MLEAFLQYIHTLVATLSHLSVRDEKASWKLGKALESSLGGNCCWLNLIECDCRRRFPPTPQMSVPVGLFFGRVQSLQGRDLLFLVRGRGGAGCMPRSRCSGSRTGGRGGSTVRDTSKSDLRILMLFPLVQPHLSTVCLSPEAPWLRFSKE